VGFFIAYFKPLSRGAFFFYKGKNMTDLLSLVRLRNGEFDFDAYDMACALKEAFASDTDLDEDGYWDNIVKDYENEN
jgi:hypothetical protein